MNAMVLIERISEAIGRGELTPAPAASAEIKIETIRDVLRPWGEGGYTGVDLDNLLYPAFTPQPRRSRRALAAPRRTGDRPKVMSPVFFASVGGVWEYYRANELAGDEFLSFPLTDDGFYEFLVPLSKALAKYWPLGSYLEDTYFWDGPVKSIRGIPLLLPHYTYDVECAGVVQSFLSGVASVHGLMEHYYGDMAKAKALGNYDHAKAGSLELELPDQDHALIRKVGFAKLVAAFAEYGGKKSCDLKALENRWETFFGPLWEVYPERAEFNYDIITDDPSGGGCEVLVRSKSDIEFAIAYAEAFDRMIDAMPSRPWDMDTNEDGALETFMHELCEVWRKINRKRSVKWTSPKLA